MKKSALALLMVAMVTVSCNKKTETNTEIINTDTVATATAEPTNENTAQIYTCSMHPEVTGSKGSKCPKCNMDLVLQEQNGNAADGVK